MKSNRMLIAGGVIAAAAMFAGAGWFAYVYTESPETKPASVSQPAPLSAAKADAPSSAPQTHNLQFIKLFQPSAQGVVVTEIGVQSDQLAVRLAESIMTEFLKQLPAGTDPPKLLGVYRDRNNILYVDISGALRSAAAGDARKEHDILKSLVLSLTANISAVKDVRLLIDGKDSSTLAGHISIAGSLRSLAQDTATAAGRI
ncbi:MAG TPA: GerMN domain-containing protein [Dissulfurispiraceae bacterium]|nr:GerMN domain-containing protein [Dissulfurispiraceae bacterium]